MTAEEVWIGLIEKGWTVQITGQQKNNELFFVASAFQTAKDDSALEKMKERTSHISATSYSWESAIEVLELKTTEINPSIPIIET